MSYKDLILTKDEGVAVVTLNRPDKLNALSAAMAEELPSVVDEIRGDDSVRAMVLTGVGRGFCSGADVSFLSTKPEGRFSIDSVTERLGSWALSMRDMPKPTIAAVNGLALGVGLSLALACDIRIASENARFSVMFVRWGMIPDFGATYFLPRTVGHSKACELTFTGETFDAREAERIGLVSRVVPHDELIAATKELATRIAKGPPIAIGFAKRAIYKGIEGDLISQLEFETYAQGVCFQTEDQREAGKAFMEKRQAEFRGR
jgi:2-(1,2-epoxy-1,2-dihydrophenyl)acetyl-CoA isomerase